MTANMIAVVTGASRGAGKGIAIALGEAGATVYVTGRSATGGETPFGGSVDETAELVSRAGGTGIGVVLDHADDLAVADFFADIRRQHGRLDLLVNNAAKVGAPAQGGFWQKPLDTADVITVGLRSHYVASYYAAPLLIANGRGLIVNTGHYGAVSYHQNPAYGAQKGRCGQNGGRYGEGATAIQCRRGFRLDGRFRYRTCSRLSRYAPRRQAPQAKARVSTIYRSHYRRAL
jgi:NAD(P)-dependent dehydrogenase (short-subunit alcohol dehydrogenase family)